MSMGWRMRRARLKRMGARVAAQHPVQKHIYDNRVRLTGTLGTIRRVHTGMPSSASLFGVKVLLPFLFASALCVVVYIAQRGVLPRDASIAEWTRFTSLILADMKSTEQYKIALLVFVAHIGHTVFCIPCVHITQMLCGYCLGFATALVVCCCSEICVATAYVRWYTASSTLVEETFDQFVCYLRQRGLLFSYIFLSQMSSIPINSTSFIIGFGNVTTCEFLCIQYVVSCINSVKCCLLGQQIRVATQPATVILLGNIIVAITLIPTLLTMGLSYFTFHVYMTQLQSTLRTTAQEKLPIKAEDSEHAGNGEEDDPCNAAADDTLHERSTSKRGKNMSFCLDFSQHEYDVIGEPSCHAKPSTPLVTAPVTQTTPPPSPLLLSVQARLPQQLSPATEDKGDQAVKRPYEHVIDKHDGAYTCEHVATTSFKDGTQPLLHELAETSVHQSPNNKMSRRHSRPIGVAAIICAPVQIVKMMEMASLALAHPSVCASALLSTMEPEPDANTDCLNCCELTSSHPPQSTEMVTY